MADGFDIVSFLMGKQAGGGGGGGDVTVESKSIDANGTYTAPAGKAYSPVSVRVPNSYAAGDEGKVVFNGALVAQGSDTATQNGTVDTTLINSLEVNVSGGGGGGLEYETGAFTPTEDIASAEISFSNTHNAMPAVVIMAEASDALSSWTNYSLFEWNYINTSDFFGGGYPRSASELGYGRVDVIRRSNSTSLNYTNVTELQYPSSEASDTTATRPRYWVTASSFKAYASNNTYYWRSGRTYKWIAVWAPTA